MIQDLNFNKKMKVFFIGIGGISMSALAMILKQNGYEVCGSDRCNSEILDKMSKSGIKIFIEHKKEHITDDIDLVVYSSAIKKDNEELAEAINKNIECIQRSKLLGLIMKNYKNAINVAGTHGKTTITSLISKILLGLNYEPTITVGGILKDISGNLYIGKNNNLFIAEACEYTNSFHDFYPTVEVISNIEEDHLDFFKDINDIRKSFKKFIDLMDENGLLVINNKIDDINYLINDYKGKCITYGINEANATYVGKNIKTNIYGQNFDLYKNDELIINVDIKLHGLHNVENAVAAITTLIEFGVDVKNVNEVISDFTGCDRRLENKGEFDGINIIDDYAHHPSEIKASLDALNTIPHNKLYVIFQPHTYTRTEILMDKFIDVLKDVDNLILVDIYAAREKNIHNISSENIVKMINTKYNKNAKYIQRMEDAAYYVKNVAKSGDLIVTMGAGDVYKTADLLINEYMHK